MAIFCAHHQPVSESIRFKIIVEGPSCGLKPEAHWHGFRRDKAESRGENANGPRVPPGAVPFLINRTASALDDVVQDGERLHVVVGSTASRTVYA